jgi:signal peptidase II
LSIALQIGGALGNVTDRIRIGHVTDFIDIGVSSWRWPAFNIADASIITGLCLLVWTILLAEREYHDDHDQESV